MVRHHALLVAVLVVLAGCGLGPGGPSGSPTGAEISHPVDLASTNTYAYRMTVTISQDGETVFSENLTGDSTTSRRQLTAINESGTYRIQVDSNITGKLGGEATADRNVTVKGGERTTLLVNPGNISIVQQPKENADSYFRLEIHNAPTLEAPMRVVLRQDGEEVFRRNVTNPHDDKEERTIFRHNATGTYQLSVKYGDSFFWTNTTFVVPPASAPDDGVRAAIKVRYTSFDVEVFGKARDRPRDDDS